MNLDNAPERKEAYKAKLQAMSRPELWKETKDKIWYSVCARNNLTSRYHWQCDYTYDEWVRRDGNGDQYAKAHTEMCRSIRMLPTF